MNFTEVVACLMASWAVGWAFGFTLRQLYDGLSAI